MPTIGTVYVDQVLSDVSVAYKNPSYISETLFPIVPVKHRTGIYYKYDKQKFQVPNDVRSQATRANRVDYGLSKQTYGPILDHSLEQDIPYEQREETVQPLDPFMDATENLTERIMLAKEVDAFNTLTSASITQTAAPTFQWSDYTNSDPFGDIRTGIDTIKQNALVMPNVLTLGYQVYTKLINHPDILERIKYTQLAATTEEILAKVFEVDKVLVASAVKNTGYEGGSDTMSFLWGKNAWLSYVTPRPGIRTVSTGYTLNQNALSGPRYTERWDDQTVKAEFVRVSYAYQHQLVAAETVYWLSSVVA